MDLVGGLTGGLTGGLIGGLMGGLTAGLGVGLGGGFGGGGREGDSSVPQPGEKALDFTLKRLHTGEKVTLSDYAGKRPVALIFGSYT